MSHDFLFMMLPREMAVLGSLMLALLFVTETPFAEMQKRRYDVLIDGMVCAFCAYNVSKRLANVEGVIHGSVRVALETKQVRFDARAELTKSLIEQALADSGFMVQAINWKVHDGNEDAAPYDQLAAKITLPVATLGSSLTEQLLDTLGTAAAGARPTCHTGPGAPGNSIAQAPVGRSPGSDPRRISGHKNGHRYSGVMDEITSLWSQP